MNTSSLPMAGNAPAAPVANVQNRGVWRSLARRLRSDPVALVCMAILLVIVLCALFAPLIAPADPFKTSMVQRLKPPGTPGYWLGTDELGRDMLSRLIHGARYSLLMGVTPVVFATFIGGGLGVLAGFLGRRVNAVIMRTLDVFFAFPSILLAVAISGTLGPGLGNSLITLTLIFIPPIARIAESVTTTLGHLDFVAAARASGASSWQIIRGHILSNVIGPVLIFASSLISLSIVVASGLSFLGLGVLPPTPEWGTMLNSLRQVIYVAPLTAIMPGLLIFVTSICFNILSDSVRSAMDTKL
jgi:peptide/nickel transport system permease protein